MTKIDGLEAKISNIESTIYEIIRLLQDVIPPAYAEDLDMLGIALHNSRVILDREMSYEK